MQVLAHALNGLEIISLQTGRPVAISDQPIIGPDNLEVVAFSCKAAGQRQALALMAQDIRQIARDCIVIDSADELGEAEDVVRLQAILDRRFKLVGTLVVSEMGSRLGRVDTYSVNLSNYLVQKLYVKQAFVKNLLFNNLIIDRTQIIDISDQQITVRDTAIKEPIAGVLPIVPE